MEAFLGTWKMETSEGFDEVLARLGIGYIPRKAANVSHPTLVFSQNGNVYTLKTVSTFKTIEISFKLGVQFDETTIDGRQVKTVVTMDGSAMKQVQEGGGKTSILIRTIDGDMMKNVFCVDELKCTRMYRKK